MARTSTMPASVRATIRYAVPGETARFYPTNRARSYWPAEEHEVEICNVRPQAERLSLERQGFVLLSEPTAVRHFSDAREVREVYYPEIAALVGRLLGAEKVIVFGEVARSDSAATGDGQRPAYGAHVDYGERSVRQFTHDLLGAREAESWLQRRFVLMNVWRPVRTVLRTPLAVCDASTVRRSELNDSEVHGGLNDPNRPTLYGYTLSYGAQHRWYYVPAMEPGEILVFKLFDSDATRVQWTAHTAFDDPSAASDAPARESIEIRTISFLS
ncbi:MAG TPA: CmcJ/NvfI family oxidoreductase [Steroidobacteraceae bacterium]|nr:CmcJ/NvfI family oxidoreductase [Steroidobacteraceae bacterium]